MSTIYSANRTGNKITVSAETVADDGPDAGVRGLGCHERVAVAIFERTGRGAVRCVDRLGGAVTQRMIDAAEAAT